MGLETIIVAKSTGSNIKIFISANKSLLFMPNVSNKLNINIQMRKQLIQRLYEILNNHVKNHGYNYLRNQIPKDFNCGIYFFFEKITQIENNQFKITYIGITKKNNNNRLEKHQINGPSSFRDHVGEAINNRNGVVNNLSIDQYIHNLPYIFITIKNIDDLKLIEKRTIELVSNFYQAPSIHIPNKDWLGYSHTQSIIPKAHIWNIQHAGGKYSDKNNHSDPLDKLSYYSKDMIK